MSNSFTDGGILVYLEEFQMLKICAKINQNLVLGSKRDVAAIYIYLEPE